MKTVDRFWNAEFPVRERSVTVTGAVPTFRLTGMSDSWMVNPVSGPMGAWLPAGAQTNSFAAASRRTVHPARLILGVILFRSVARSGAIVPAGTFTLIHSTSAGVPFCRATEMTTSPVSSGTCGFSGEAFSGLGVVVRL
ncbi:hypothetical protein AB0D08_28005 [Kitasatospora sp. NPDC048540]|uniref:hypothetical protein n=1 Tax=Kitasatospora sp. NPDC048540 TaxID=3155634 RepID=UPI003408BE66